MLLLCVSCGGVFSDRQVILGKPRNLHGRRQCLECLPFRPRRSPSVRNQPPPKTLTCQKCGNAFPAKMWIDGKLRSLYRRRFCLDCSPFGAHNSSRNPPGKLSAEDLLEFRRRKRNAKTYRSLKKRRRTRKSQLVAASGGRCVDCGYDRCFAALEFHHRERSSKEFGLSDFGGALARLLVEADKCDLVCANCHRLRHLAADPTPLNVGLAEERRRRKTAAVALMGGSCSGCWIKGPLTLFEFHHRDARDKSFGISQDGIMRTWDIVVAELAKCVMLCANCHREVHAGVRIPEPKIGEAASAYAA